MSKEEEQFEDSDSSDEDYIPGKKPEEVVSEEDSDGIAEDDLIETEDADKSSKKRKKPVKNNRKKQRTDFTTPQNDNSEQIEPTEEEKKRKEENIWLDFMKDTGFQSKKSLSNNVTTNAKTPIKTTNNDNKSKLETKKTQDKVKITQIFDFAGEDVIVEKEVATNSAEARLLNKSTDSNTGRPKGGLSGISGVLSQLGKKPKISTLEKSKLDWDRFKKEENLEEEFQTHNKGKDGYLERQDFLQRADLRRFEIEKEIRSLERSKRMNNAM